MRTSRPPVILLTFIALATTAYASDALRDAATVGWSPALRIWGSGDAPKAIAGLGELARASDAMLHHRNVDESSQEFWDDALDELEHFDLEGFYEMLPPARGGFHELRVRGELKGGEYQVRRSAPGDAFAVAADGPRHALFDLEQLLRVKPVHDGGDHDSYLIQSRLGFGAGEVKPADLLTASSEVARLTAQADPRAGARGPLTSSSRAVARVRALHPGLGSEDVETLAVMFDAFPRVFEVLGRVGVIEDIRDPRHEGAYSHIRLKMRALPDRLEDHHRHLAKYMEKLDELTSLHLTLSDRKGRTLGTLTLDTETLTAETECYLSDGKLLPFSRTKVYVDEPLDPRSGDLDHARVRIDLRVDLLGIVLKMRGIRLDVSYAYADDAIRIGSTMRRAPQHIDVEGAALGFLPPRLIDAFIPGDIHGLAMDFFRTAGSGNGGRGIRMEMGLATAEGSDEAVLDLQADLEALDNRLVKMGVKMVNERVLPSDDVSDDTQALLSDMHAAFVADLERFEKHAPD